ncbi:MAG: EAL domain-containing protein, partial [Candidatus Dormibacteraeota bacterium]|nr:EAL domain-containing protein [Candidatus Dormibacteraeota bacterium]
MTNFDHGPEEPFWAAPPPVRPLPGPPSPDQRRAAMGVVRRLIQPGQMRVTAEPVRRLADGAVLGYQLRWRLPRLDEVPSPEDFWRAAEAADLLEALDDALLRAQLAAARHLRPSALLVSLVGYRRSRPGVAGILAKEARLADIPAARIVWQLSEGDTMVDGAPAPELAFDLRLRGFKVGLIGLGESRTRLSEVARITPELLHVDSSLVGSALSDPGAAALVAALGEFARLTGAVLVASDIEDQAELEAVSALGLEYGTGTVFGGPQVVHGPGQVELVRPRVILDIDGPDVFAKEAPRPATTSPGPRDSARRRPSGAREVTDELG